MTSTDPRLLILGAHPDDAEFHAGGLAVRYREQGYPVKMVSVTDGGAGHHQRRQEELVETRRAEAAAAGNVIGAEYVTWSFPDGNLQPTLDVREQIIRELRTYKPDLVLTHRTNDYHPDHRAVGQAVQDASYMVTVPLVVPDTPFLQTDPVVAYMTDLFTKPCQLEPTVLLDIEPEFDRIVQMLAQHHSQVFEFLPFNQGIEERVPATRDERQKWLAAWFADQITPRAERFRQQLVDQFGPEHGKNVHYTEAYEVSEYAADVDAAALARLFPQR